MTEIFGKGGLPFIRIETPWSAAEIYLQGATVTHFQLHGEPPVLFLSEASRFEPEAPIRGGIPIVFPWFGKPENRAGQHGFARNRKWEVLDVQKHPDGNVSVQLTLPESAELLSIPVSYRVTLGKTLTTELTVTNFSPLPFQFESCLHTYFTVGDIHQAEVVGLKGKHYLDALEARKRRQETEDSIRFTGEVDRIYQNAPVEMEIRDAALGRSIRLQQTGAKSAVVWNPWIAKAKAMPDFGDAEFQRMVCVESGNIAENHVSIEPGLDARLELTLATSPLT
jgi:D-hexose-6-phosphate mutarotase